MKKIVTLLAIAGLPEPEDRVVLARLCSRVENDWVGAHTGLLDQLASLFGEHDRALRIEPNNPLLWIELGRLRLAESDAHQAEGCGRKALALASGDPSTQKQAGMLLADALRAQRRNQEAHEVESQPFMH